MKFIDLFCGIGGFRYGLQKVEVKSENSTNSKSRTSQYGKCPFRCVWSNEWNKYASQIYKKHYGECDTRDIRTVKAREIPDHDLLCAGFPCQAFSVAGKRKGFEDTRGTLFFEIARIVKHKRPRYLLLENVKGLLSHQEGKTFQTIIGVLSDLGYRVEWQVLNSKHFGVPQNRERVFIIGHLGKKSGQKVFPIGSDSKQNDKTATQKESSTNKVAQTLTVHYAKNQHGSQYVLEEPTKLVKVGTSGKDAQGNRIYDSKGISATLQGLAEGKGAKTGLYAVRVQGDLDKRKTYLSNEAQTLSANPTSDNLPRIKQGMRIRRLTPTECERLQGFPDGWTEGVSDTQRYKCLGNAVTTNVIKEIGIKLSNSI